MEKKKRKERECGDVFDGLLRAIHGTLAISLIFDIVIMVYLVVKLGYIA